MGAAFTQPALRVTPGKWGSARRTLPPLNPAHSAERMVQRLAERHHWLFSRRNASCEGIG
jgi:hypothetical protein